MIKKTVIFTLLLACNIHADQTINQPSIDALIEKGREAINNKQKDQAYNIFKTILAKDPQNINALFYLGITYYYDNNTTNAIPCLVQAFKINPKNTSITKTLGFILNDHGKFDDALNILESLYEQDRTNNQIKTKLLPLYLRAMDWYYALKLCSVDNLWWHNESIKGKTALLDVSSEWNGLGDVLQIIRYAKTLTNAGAIVTVKTRAELIPLLSLCPYIHTLIPSSTKPNPVTDKTYTLLADNFVLRTRDTTYKPSKDVPYLFADQTRIAYWKRQLQHDTKFKVGICWQSTKMRDYFTGTIIPGPRAMKLDQLKQLLNVNNVNFYSIQQGEDGQIVQLNQQGFSLLSFKQLDKDGAFMDTAAIMKNLDLIITVDTSIAHLAGGLGVPVWVMLPYAADFRWFSDRDDSPYYPTMKLFRQKTNGDWLSVINNVTQQLKKILK